MADQQEAIDEAFAKIRDAYEASRAHGEALKAEGKSDEEIRSILLAEELARTERNRVVVAEAAQEIEQRNGPFLRGRGFLAALGDHSTIGLVASNLISIGFALYYDWDVSTILWLYWCQSVTIGIFAAVRMFTLQQFSTDGLKMNHQLVPESAEGRNRTATFFVMHYGLFHAVYAGALIANGSHPEWYSVISMAGLFVLNHWYSYRETHAADRVMCPNLGTLMFTPYLRILPMHLFLGPLVSLASPGMFMVVSFLLAKTFADALMHIIQHANLPVEQPHI